MNVLDKNSKNHNANIKIIARKVLPELKLGLQQAISETYKKINEQFAKCVLKDLDGDEDMPEAETGSE